MKIYVPVFQTEKEFSEEYGMNTVLSMDDVNKPISDGFIKFEQAERYIINQGYRKSKDFNNGFYDFDYEKDTDFPYEYASIFIVTVNPIFFEDGVESN